jgi:hypothetical protein
MENGERGLSSIKCEIDTESEDRCGDVLADFIKEADDFSG